MVFDLADVVRLVVDLSHEAIDFERGRRDHLGDLLAQE
jgi:hypothetical protein